jgi:tetratricopeptide (TPR) repeat protein
MTAAPFVVLALLAADPATPPGARPAGPPAEARIGAPTATTAVPAPPARGPATPQRPARALTREENARLLAAQDHRLAGRFPQAAEALAALAAAAPRHPAVVTEQVRLRLAQDDLDGAVRLARDERAAQRDSVLVARELAYALERLGRPAEVAGVVLEAWAASATVTDWAQGTLLRLAADDPRGTRERVRRLARARPGRADLALAAALLDWRTGDRRAALAGLDAADVPGEHGSLRRDFAEELVGMESPGDSAAAIAALVSLAGDARFPAARRLLAGERAWELQGVLGGRDEAAPALAHALRDVPPDRWPVRLLADIARVLREGGHTALVRDLLRPDDAAGGAAPELELEAALADLRDGPPGRVLPRLAALAATGPAGAWHHAEALFFAGAADSALARYQRLAADPRGPFRGAALERIYLVEDADPRGTLPVLGRIAYDDWRGERGAALARTDSLAGTLPRGPLWARLALLSSAQRALSGDAAGALAPLLAVADSLPDDRLAPLARQRAGDLLLGRLNDPAAARAQYEECLARYPRAWNAPEVRRAVERLRREPRP